MAPGRSALQVVHGNLVLFTPENVIWFDAQAAGTSRIHAIGHVPAWGNDVSSDGRERIVLMRSHIGSPQRKSEEPVQQNFHLVNVLLVANPAPPPRYSTSRRKPFALEVTFVYDGWRSLFSRRGPAQRAQGNPKARASAIASTALGNLLQRPSLKTTGTEAAGGPPPPGPWRPRRTNSPVTPVIVDRSYRKPGRQSAHSRNCHAFRGYRRDSYLWSVHFTWILLRRLSPWRAMRSAYERGVIPRRGPPCQLRTLFVVPRHCFVMTRRECADEMISPGLGAEITV